MMRSHGTTGSRRSPAEVVGPLATAFVLTALAACSGTTTPMPDETFSPEPRPRTHWEMRHRVIDTPGIEVSSQWLDDQEEGTGVMLVNAATRQRHECFVSVSGPGGRNPADMVGEKSQTTFDDHPAVRSGAGAESDYLMWELPDRSWVSISCSDIGSRSSVDRVAAAVELSPTTIRVPVDLQLPEGVRPSVISIDLTKPSARIYLDAPGTDDRGDLVIRVGEPDQSEQPDGEPVTFAGRPAVINDNKTSPSVWVQEQGFWISVGAWTSDTGPYPNRSGELPTIRTLAESFSFARSLSDPTTWFPAEDVFG